MAGVVTATETAVPVAPSSNGEAGGNRRTRLAGLGFTLFFLVGFPLTTWTWDDPDIDSEIVSWYAESGNRMQQIVGLYMLALAGLCLLVFLVGLRGMLRRRPASEVWSSVGFTSGSVFVAVLFAGAAAIAATSAAVEFGDVPLPESADVLRGIEQIGFTGILLFGGLAAALTVGALSYAAKQAAAFPRWLVTTGYVFAVLLIASVVYMPLALFPIWVALVATFGLRRRSPALS